ncbi:hypothetical protein IC007_2395 [Sulfuracidifex tepidarius]|uniref:Uncharacterized protein n=1 Tax=Sulfuracidifex tepidarius TaxID=1294262 RepID=A0A510E715_9CREN|nr:hypothetical protein IC007_2395 [Sulfuracidifex tepidarius]
MKEIGFKKAKTPECLTKALLYFSVTKSVKATTYFLGMKVLER